MIMCIKSRHCVVGACSLSRVPCAIGVAAAKSAAMDSARVVESGGSGVGCM